MYPYYNRIKSRIKNGELISYHFENDYPRIGECLVLEFSTAPFVRPIRPYRYTEYVDILAEWQRKQEVGNEENNV